MHINLLPESCTMAKLAIKSVKVIALIEKLDI